MSTFEHIASCLVSWPGLALFGGGWYLTGDVRYGLAMDGIYAVAKAAASDESGYHTDGYPVKGPRMKRTVKVK